MIQVRVDMTRATREEVESLYALPGFSRAFDELCSSGRSLGIQLDLLQPAPPAVEIIVPVLS